MVMTVSLPSSLIAERSLEYSFGVISAPSFRFFFSEQLTKQLKRKSSTKNFLKIKYKENLCKS